MPSTSTPKTQCSICGESADMKSLAGELNRDAVEYNCPVCGRYRLTGTAARTIQSCGADKVKRAAVSHAVKKIYAKSASVVLESTDMARLFEASRLPNAAELTDNLILWIADNTPAPGVGVEFEAKKVRAIVGALDDDAVQYALVELERLQLLKIRSAGNYRYDSTLGLSGWRRIEELEKGRIASRRALMAMKFQNEALTKIFKEHLIPAVGLTGFELHRLDTYPTAGSIDDRLRVEIRRSKFIVCDLTDENRGAYWEGGFAEGLGKPVIYLCEETVFKNRPPHFDTNHLLILKWKTDNPKEVAEQLKATIRNTLPGEAKMTDD